MDTVRATEKMLSPRSQRRRDQNPWMWNKP